MLVECCRGLVCYEPPQWKKRKTRTNQSEQAEMCMKVFAGITGEDTRITTDPAIEVHTALVQV